MVNQMETGIIQGFTGLILKSCMALHSIYVHIYIYMCTFGELEFSTARSRRIVDLRIEASECRFRTYSV